MICNIIWSVDIVLWCFSEYYLAIHSCCLFIIFFTTCINLLGFLCWLIYRVWSIKEQISSWISKLSFLLLCGLIHFWCTWLWSCLWLWSLFFLFIDLSLFFSSCLDILFRLFTLFLRVLIVFIEVNLFNWMWYLFYHYFCYFKLFYKFVICTTNNYYKLDSSIMQLIICAIHVIIVINYTSNTDNI